MWRVAAGQIISGGVGSDGSVVVVGSPKGEVLAFDAATGREAWKARVSSEVLAAPVVADGLAVVRSGDSRIFAFDIADGKRRWVFQRSTPSLSLRSNVGVMPAGKFTLAGFPGGKLVAIANNNGAAVWEVTVALPRGATEPSAGGCDQHACCQRHDDLRGGLPGAGWPVSRAAPEIRFGPARCPPALGSTWTTATSMSRTTKVRFTAWTGTAVPVSGSRTSWPSDPFRRPLGLDKYVAVADYQGYIHLLRREDGAFAARIATDGSAIRGEPLRMGSGLLVQTTNGSLHALEAR